MIVKEITFTDYNGTVHDKEKFYFNISKAELISLEASYPGGVSDHLQEIVAKHDYVALYKFFIELIRLSYGIKSPDGRRFMKNEEIWRDFSESEAYSALLDEFISDPDKVQNFVSGIIPEIKQ